MVQPYTTFAKISFELAKKGNATMLIWLGKQYLGQSDKPIAEEHEEEVNVEDLSKMLCSILGEAAARHRASVGESSDTAV